MLLVKELELLNGKKVSLELNKGQGYVLQGPNGSGKSVLMRTLAGLYPAKYSAFSFQGKNIEEYPAEEMRSRILYSSSSTSLPGEMTSEEFLAAPFKLGVYKGHQSPIEFKDYLRKWHLKGMPLAQLSSGQKQLLVLMRALSLKAELLLLDEPTSHMDSERTQEIEDLLKLWLNPDRSYLVVSHSNEQAIRLGTKINFSEITSE